MSKVQAQRLVSASFLYAVKPAVKLNLMVSFEVQENLDHEKKLRSDVEKAKRKLENDLKEAQDAVDELEGIKRSLEEGMKRFSEQLNAS